MATATLTTLDPALAVLASATGLQFGNAPVAQRPVDRVIEQQQASLPHKFDGREMRVMRYVQRQDGGIHVADGVQCTCEGAQYCGAVTGLSSTSCLLR